MFYRLKVLTFSHNEVSSLKFLAEIPWRRLQALIAHHNKITSLEGLASATLPKLKEIFLRKKCLI